MHANCKIFIIYGSIDKAKIKPELSERQHSSPAATICKYCIQGKFFPRFIFALLSVGEFKTG